MELWAVIVAAGSGSRFGRPKQLERLGGSRVIDRSVAVLKPHVAGIVVVGPPELGTAESLRVDLLVSGGVTRSDSVRSGLHVIPASASHVLVHDAARPLVTDVVVSRVVDALQSGAMAAVPVVPVVDTLRRLDGTPVSRDELVAVQTPQGFAVAQLAAAHASGEVATDDAALIQRIGGTVVQVEGIAENLKITYPADLAVAETILALREGLTNKDASNSDPDKGTVGIDTVSNETVSNDTVSNETVAGENVASERVRTDTTERVSKGMRIGQGFDVHPWSDDKAKTLVLGGVAFPGMVGLDGHSDADAIAHACTDAVLGAAGIGDIGQMFPDTDPRLAGANSIELLALAAAEVAQAGWSIVNIDCTVVLDEPKIAPVRQQMEQNLMVAVGGPVTVKGKRTEGLSDLAQGVRCYAVALLAMRDAI